MLDQTTPVLLTYNEEQKISRTLSHLTWAKDIVVVDSDSTDGSVAVLRLQSSFRHPRQAMAQCNARDKNRHRWVLRLDAHYQVSDSGRRACSARSESAVSAYRVKFDYAVFAPAVGGRGGATRAMTSVHLLFAMELAGSDGVIHRHRSNLVNEDRVN